MSPPKTNEVPMRQILSPLEFSSPLPSPKDAHTCCMQGQILSFSFCRNVSCRFLPSALHLPSPPVEFEQPPFQPYQDFWLPVGWKVLSSSAYQSLLFGQNVTRGIALVFLLLMFSFLMNENGIYMIIALLVVLPTSICYRTFLSK